MAINSNIRAGGTVLLGLRAPAAGNRKRKKRGYSLVELMLVVAILGILFSAAYPLMMQMTNFWRLTTARNNIQRDVRVSLDTVNRFTRQAIASTVVLDQVTGQPPYSRLSFTSVQGKSTSFYQSGNRLLMSVDGRVSPPLSTNLAFIAFTYPRSDDTSILSVAVTMQSPTYMGGKKALQLSIQKVRIMN